MPGGGWEGGPDFAATCSAPAVSLRRFIPGGLQEGQAAAQELPTAPTALVRARLSWPENAEVPLTEGTPIPCHPSLSLLPSRAAWTESVLLMDILIAFGGGKLLQLRGTLFGSFIYAPVMTPGRPL